MFNHGIHGRHGITALALIAGAALSFCVKAAEPVRGAYLYKSPLWGKMVFE